MARSLAARTGRPVQVLEHWAPLEGPSRTRASECSPAGRVRSIRLPARPWSDPNVWISAEPGYHPARIEDQLQVVDSARAYGHVGGQALLSGVEENERQQPPEFQGSAATLWVPIGWVPDPLPPGLRLPASPRRLAAGQAPSLDLGAELGSYLCWRAIAANVLEEQPAPDIARWTERLLRRHGLLREPEDEAHPYWEDWEQATRKERSARGSPGKLPSYKLEIPGNWLLDPDEAGLLASALSSVPLHHRVPPEHREALIAVLALLTLGHTVEVTVR